MWWSALLFSLLAGGGHYWLPAASVSGQLVGQPLAAADWRLSQTTIDPLAYSLTLRPSLESLTFTADLLFTFVPLHKGINKITLNSKNLFYDGAATVVQTDDGQLVAVDSLDLEPALERLTLSLVGPLQRGKVHSILFRYSGNITEDGAGLHRSSYTDAEGNKQWMLVSQMRPVHTRKVFPCLDEPAFRSHFKLTVLHSPKQFAVSNMPPLQTTVIGGNKIAVTEFLETPRIPVFLTGLLVSGLGAVQGGGGFTSLAAPADLGAAGYSALIGPRLAAAMEQLVHIPYPQVKTHQVALPRLVPVAMENWGLFNFRRENILYDEGRDPTVQKQTAARFSGHEVAHAWLGNSVTIAWWDWLWLSEMFAMYLEYFLPHMVEPSWRMEEQMVLDLGMAGLRSDTPRADPLTTAVLTPPQISAKFSGLTYTKGPAILRMVQTALGLVPFFRGVRSYLEEHWESSVTPVDLWRALEKEGNFPTRLEDIMATWTEQPGYPLVSVALKEQGAVLISQSAFDGGSSSTTGVGSQNGSWWVPLSWASSAEPLFDPRPKLWLAPGQSLSLPLPKGSLILLNVFAAGFYRVKYDSELLNRLSQTLHSEHLSLPALSRASLVDDCLALVSSSQLEPASALRLVSYLAGETDFIVWKKAGEALLGSGGFPSRIVSSDLYPLYKKFLLSLSEKAYEKLGLLDRPQESHTDRVQRQILTGLSCRAGSRDCLRAAGQLAGALLSGTPVRVSPDVRAALECTAVQEGDTNIINYFIAKYNETEDNAAYLTALSCNNDPEHLGRLLIEPESTITDDEWRKRYTALAGRRENANNLLNLLHQNIDKIISRFGTKGLSGFITQISGVLGTKKHSELVADFERLGVGELDTAKSNIRSNGDWLNKNVPSIINFFKSNKKYALILS